MALFSDLSSNVSKATIFDLGCQQYFDAELEDEIQRECAEEIVLRSGLVSKVRDSVEESLKRIESGELREENLRIEGVGNKYVEFMAAIYMISKGENPEAR